MGSGSRLPGSHRIDSATPYWFGFSVQELERKTLYQVGRDAGDPALGSALGQDAEAGVTGAAGAGAAESSPQEKHRQGHRPTM